MAIIIMIQDFGHIVLDTVPYVADCVILLREICKSAPALIDC
jgi:hypothetical protein